MPKTLMTFQWERPNWGTKYTWRMKNLRFFNSKPRYLGNCTRWGHRWKTRIALCILL